MARSPRHVASRRRRGGRDALVAAAITAALYVLALQSDALPRVVAWAQRLDRLHVDDALVLVLLLPAGLLAFVVLRMAALRAEIARRREVEAQLAWNAEHDALTGLGNRRTIDEALKAASTADGPGTALLFLDLDGFKEINDALGHTVGDEVLAITAARLRGVVRPQDTVARFGGDEFLIVARDVDVPAATGLARRAADALAAPFVVAGREVRVSTSIGVAHGSGGEDTGRLLARADAAMYRVKRNARAPVLEAG